MDENWRRVLKWLRAAFPPRLPVRVVRQPREWKQEDNHGYTLFNGRSFYVFVNAKQSWSLQMDSLLHEWAHILAWPPGGEDVHWRSWGIAYARIYRAFLTWNYGE